MQLAILHAEFEALHPFLDMYTISRRTALKLIATTSVSVAWSGRPATALVAFLPTPPEVRGPFYPLRAQRDRDFDLTHIEGRAGHALGQVIHVEGQVVDMANVPVGDAVVELWQANAYGRYNHPYDANPAPLDPNFQGWAVVPAGRDGGFGFRTVMPGAYQAGPDWRRPPHLHFRVTRPGHPELVTQMYFPGHPLNATDLLLRRKRPAERALMIASAPGDGTTYRYRLVLRDG